MTALRSFAKNVWTGRVEHDVDRVSAALAYFMMLAFAPFLALLAIIASRFVDPRFVNATLHNVVARFVGAESAGTITAAVASYAARAQPSSGVALVAIVLTLWGSVALFGQVSWALRRTWGVPEPRGIRGAVLVSLLGLGAVAVLTAVFVALVTVLALTSSAGHSASFKTVRLLIACAVIALTFAGAYRLMSGAKPAWRDVLLGAAPAALVYGVGSFFLGAYLGSSFTISAWGTAGSILAVLIWAYFSANVFLTGAEFARAFGEMRAHPAETPAS